VRELAVGADAAIVFVEYDRSPEARYRITIWRDACYLADPDRTRLLHGLAQQSDLEDHSLMTPGSKDGSQQPSLLAVYLNDHLGGATGGLELVRRTARAHRDLAAGDALRQLAAQICEDRRTLLAIMQALGVPIHRYKIAVGYLAEKAARLKPNGRILHRSPLSSVVELESLRLGIMGKAAGWVVLRMRADSDPRLDAGELDDLIARATRQAATVEELRVRAAAEAFD
jgi:hypothetical protein